MPASKPLQPRYSLSTTLRHCSLTYSIFCISLLWFLFTLSACPQPKALEDFPAEYSGAGLEIKVIQKRIVVVTPLPDSPSQIAGILPGDIIVAINNTPAKVENFEDVVRQLRGRPKTQVTILLERRNEQFHVVITRQAFIKDGSGYRFQKNN